MPKRNKKYHWYDDTEPDESKKTACGRDGAKVGALISFFFRLIRVQDRCRICDKAFKI